MGLIGRFIDNACERQPAIMACVLEKPFGPLNEWINWRGDTPCGCLIGTIALCSGKPTYEWDQHFVPEVAANCLYGKAEGWLYLTEEVGMRVLAHSERLYRKGFVPEHEADAAVVALLKARIARALTKNQAPSHA
jgi:hypothetical protein